MVALTKPRAKRLLSGLIICGICGSNFTISGKDCYRCAAEKKRQHRPVRVNKAAPQAHTTEDTFHCPAYSGPTLSGVKISDEPAVFDDGEHFCWSWLSLTRAGNQRLAALLGHGSCGAIDRRPD
ncbi:MULTISPECIES: zinc ribbon domain-containing protein [unclassified Sphingomonas]|uniref:zinc ribbon domain-containing protein n=1 Tax=unclassified Sphingomonas TaxID=196159 RepID=UPI0009E69949|nr:zinc ribbon domain-containing protein [Sphingomonas sp. CCH9-E2]